jgi:hypothetical protein
MCPVSLVQALKGAINRIHERAEFARQAGHSPGLQFAETPLCR